MDSFKKPMRRQRVRDEKEQTQITGGQIRHHRTKRGLTQSELGKELGVTYQQVQKYEKGIGLSAWARGIEIAKILDISLIELAGHNGTAKAKRH